MKAISDRRFRARTRTSNCSRLGLRLDARCNTDSAVRNIAKVKEFSEQLAGIVRSNPHLNNVVFDWMEPARVVKVDVSAGQGAPARRIVGGYRHYFEQCA